MEISSLGMSAAVEALSRVQAGVAQTAGRIAEATTSPAGDTLDLSAEMIALMSARQQAAMLTKVVGAVSEVESAALNVLG